MTAKVDSREAMGFAMELADLARPIALKYFRTPLTVASKSDGTPVTLADQAIETELRRRIRERFPDHGIIGEETGGGRGERYTWIIDPIDGTRSFVSGCPLFGTMIGLLREDEPIFGLIDIPATGERWAGDGRETNFNGRKAHASDCALLGEARLYTTSIDIPAAADLEHLNRVCSGVSFTRYSGDCYAYGLLASGHCDLVIDFGLDPYDYLPLVGVVTGAGAAITDWEARPLHVQSDGRVVAAATQSLLHQAIRALQATG